MPVVGLLTLPEAINLLPMTHPATDDVRRPDRLIRAIALLGGLLLAILSLSPNGATRILAWPWWAGWRLLLAIPPFLLVAIYWRHRGAKGHGIPPAFLLLVLANAALQVIAGAFSSHPADSLSAAINTLSASAMAVLVAHVSAINRQNLQRIARIIGGAAAIFAVVSLVSWTIGDVLPTLGTISRQNAIVGADVFHLDPNAMRNDRPLGHSNYTAGAMLLVLPWIIALAATASRRARWPWIAASILAAATLLSSASRGAVLGIGGGSLFCILLFARLRNWRWQQVLGIGALGCLLTLAIAAAVPRVRHSVIDSVSNRHLNSGDVQRYAMLQVGTRMGLERWWVGQGPGLTPRLYPRYRHTVDGGVETALQLHSTPLQIWADTGIPGLLAFVALSGWACLASFRPAKSESADDPRPWRLAAGTSLAAYGTFALTDYQLNIPLFAALVAANLGVLAGNQRTGASSAYGNVALSFGALALLLHLGLSIPDTQSRRLIAQAVGGLERDNDFRQFDDRIARAAALCPDNPNADLAGATAYLRFGYLARDAEKKTELLASAQTHLRRALAIEPTLEFAHFNLGWLQLAESPQRAAKHFREAIPLAPSRGGVYFGLALARLEAGDTARAIDAFALELLNDPEMVTSPAWDTAFLAPHLQPAIDRAIALTDSLATNASPAQREELAQTGSLLHWCKGNPDAAPPPALAAAPSAASPERLRSGPATLRSSLEPGVDRKVLLRDYLRIRHVEGPLDERIAILEHLLDQLGDDWQAWIQAPEGREPPFAQRIRRDRPGFAMLAGNMDIPVPFDDYVVQENGLVQLFFSPIFPARGHLSDSLLLNYVARSDL